MHRTFVQQAQVLAYLEFVVVQVAPLHTCPNCFPLAGESGDHVFGQWSTRLVIVTVMLYVMSNRLSIKAQAL